MGTGVRLLVVCLLSAVVVFAPTTYRPVQAQSGWVLYDDFNSLLINPAKWYGSEGVDPVFPPPRGAAEISRILVAGELALYQRMHGNPVNESQNYHNMRLNARSPNSITAMRTKITVRHYQLIICPANPAGSDVRARLDGAFFNTGSPVPGSVENDVRARIEVRRLSNSVYPSNVFEVRASVFRYINPAGNEADAPDPVVLGTVTVGQSTTVSIRWDYINSMFIFKKDGNPQVPIAYPTDWVNNSTPSDPFKALGVASYIENCTAPTSLSSILATFDNFYVNP